MAIPVSYHTDSDVEEDYDPTAIKSPKTLNDPDRSPTNTDTPSTEPTPTGLSHFVDIGKRSPRGDQDSILSWSSEQCVAWLNTIGLGQYSNEFLDNEISGESLIALRQDELKEMGIVSVGHRLTILKGIFDVKMAQQIPLDQDDYKPPSTEASSLDQTATMSDISRIIKSIDIRDHRIQAAEAELKKITEEYRRLRDELLPVFRWAKNGTQPLPYHPQGHPSDNVDGDRLSPLVATLSPEAKTSNGNSGSALLGRKASKRGIMGSLTPKSSSPTHVPSAIAEQRYMPDPTTLDPSAAAIAASNHLTPGLTSNSQSIPSPNTITIPSPTSPSQYSSSSRGYTPSSLNRYPYSDESGYSTTANLHLDRGNPTPTSGTSSQGRRGTYINHPSTISTASTAINSTTSTGTASTLIDDFNNLNNNNNASSHHVLGTTPISSTNLIPSSSSLTPTSTTAPSSASNPPPNSSTSSGVEIFKSFRVSMDDPCEKVLPAALKKYNINADWKNYALYIVFGDQERCLGLKEKPLILFKQLDKEGRKPMFMLRRHAAPMEGHSGPCSTVAGGAGGVGGVNGNGEGYYGGGGGGSAGIMGSSSGRGNTGSIQLPGGVL